MSSSSARSRSAARLGAARRGEQALHLVAAQDLRQPAAGARAAQVGGRIALEDLLAAQVAVEGAQAGGLALQRRGRGGRAVRRAAGASSSRKPGDVARA